MKRKAFFIISLITIVFMAMPAMSWGATILSLEAWETQGVSSCPWVYTWNGTGFEKDNDIYSVARYKTGEYIDFYVLQKPLLLNNGSYNLEIREVTSEISWTDYVGLFAVDHAADVAIGTNERGDVFSYKPSELIKPVSALSNSGSDVKALLSTIDNSGFGVYSEDYVEIDFGNVDVSQGARVVLRVRGFVPGTGSERPYIGPPAVIVQTFNGTGWQEIGRLRPRDDWSTGMFDLSSYLPDINGNRKIRLYSISHGVRYHEIDFVGLSVGPQPPISLNRLTLISASFRGNNVINILSNADDNYLQMGEGEKFSLSFASVSPSMPNRDFIFVSKGYYIPDNTYYIYIWDGSSWVQRDSYAFPGSDFTQTFDLSAYLPDANGQYKVRIRQTFNGSYDARPAGIDFVGLQIDGANATLLSATDLVTSNDISSLVSASDDVRFEYTSDVGARWTEYQWDQPLPVSVPTMTEWGMIIFTAFAGLGSIYYLRRQRRAKS